MRDLPTVRQLLDRIAHLRQRRFDPVLLLDADVLVRAANSGGLLRLRCDGCCSDCGGLRLRSFRLSVSAAAPG